MHEGSRFASLSRRAHALLGSGTAAPALTAVVVEGTAAPAAAAENDAAAEAAAAAAAEAEATAAAEAQAAEEAEAARIAEEAAAAQASNADAVTAARAEERQRVADVFASDASVGKERVAAKMLANPKLDASDIIALLPDTNASASDNMLATLAGAPNPDLGAGAEAAGAKPDASASWGRTFERMGWAPSK